MLSLAPVRYRSVFADDGGPIARVETGSVEVAGHTLAQANAYLQPELTSGKSTFAVWGQADGTGTHVSPAIASHMAISEALERWAFLALHDTPAGAAYGFDADSSSNGMAAYPGLFKSQARNRARMEALERYAVISWWDGRLPCQILPEVEGMLPVRILHDAGPGEVVILTRTSRLGTAYGHAAGHNVAAATAKAAVELSRADYVLRAFRAKGALGKSANFLEQRTLHFASPAGWLEFKDRLRRPPDRPAKPWNLRFDGEIPGPWSRWATVWRCAVDMPTQDFLKPDVNFFFW